jgi:hypothetical protein
MVYPCDAKTLRFDEITLESRVRVTDDNLIYVVDLIMVTTGKARRGAVGVLRLLLQDALLQTKFTARSTGGKGNRKTRLVSMKDALDVIRAIPSKKANRKMKCAKIIRQYLGDLGERSPVKEIDSFRQQM